MGQLRTLGALIVGFIALTNDMHLPGNIRAILLTISGAILTAEHIVDGIATVPSATVTPGAAPVSTGQVQTGADSSLPLA